MICSDRGADAIRNYEGCVLKAYLCPAKVWTIGWGHTGKEVVSGLQWTQRQADEAFLRDLSRFESGVTEAVTVPLKRSQFDALVSLAYNIGLGAFIKSTLLRYLNAGDTRGAACQFVVWNKADGKMNPGLLQRRASELYRFAGGED